jgi:hypothetical protein
VTHTDRAFLAVTVSAGFLVAALTGAGIVLAGLESDRLEVCPGPVRAPGTPPTTLSTEYHQITQK